MRAGFQLKLIVKPAYAAAVIALCLLLGTPPLAAQQDVLPKRLQWFQDQKFGLFVHWGIYSQLGIIESWPLVWADRSWSNPAIKTKDEMAGFRQKYFALHRTFNPIAFNPDDWARAAKDAGMRYVVFTTKHHDGFSMFHTKLTGFKITSPEVPFSRHSQANISAEVFEAFRKQGFGIGAYFSKSDWNSPHYWRPDRFAEDRNPNFDTSAEPERWANFVQFVHGQVEELMTGYGPIDILWLDGGQVKPPKQDIQMDKLVAMARGHQPGLIVVDRTSGTVHENYRTPEQEVPTKPLDYTWESCITMGTQWSYKPDDKYKSTHQLIQLLVDIVAKGGNLLLNIGAQPNGQLPAEALSRLKEIGAWMAVNGEAVHGTRPIAPYKHGRVALTQKQDTIYAIYMPAEEKDPLPESINIPVPRRQVARAAILGSGESLKLSGDLSSTVLELPEATKRSTGHHALVVKLSLSGPPPGRQASPAPK